MQPLTICSTKYDNSLHRRYEVLLLEEAEWGWLTYQERNLPVKTGKGQWLTVHPCLGYHWRNQWWDAMLVFDREGRWLEWYCNVITPPRLEEGELRFYDLDLDVIWHREKGLLIADVDEFDLHSVEMAYPPDLIRAAWESAHRVRDLIAARAWRFAEPTDTLDLKQELAPWLARLT